MYMYMCMSMCMSYIYIYVCRCVCIGICRFLCICICICICRCRCRCRCMCICTCICICVPSQLRSCWDIFLTDMTFMFHFQQTRQHAWRRCGRFIRVCPFAIRSYSIILDDTAWLICRIRYHNTSCISAYMYIYVCIYVYIFPE